MLNSKKLTQIDIGLGRVVCRLDPGYLISNLLLLITASNIRYLKMNMQNKLSKQVNRRKNSIFTVMTK